MCPEPSMLTYSSFFFRAAEPTRSCAKKKSSVSLDGILAKPTRPSRGNQLHGDYQKTVFVSTETPLRKSEKRSRAIPLIDRRASRLGAPAPAPSR